MAHPYQEKRSISVGGQHLLIQGLGARGIPGITTMDHSLPQPVNRVDIVRVRIEDFFEGILRTCIPFVIQKLFALFQGLGGNCAANANKYQQQAVTWFSHSESPFIVYKYIQKMIIAASPRHVRQNSSGPVPDTLV